MTPPAALDKKRVPREGCIECKECTNESKCRRVVKRESDLYNSLKLHVTFFSIPKGVGVIAIVKQRPVLSTI